MNRKKIVVLENQIPLPMPLPPFPERREMEFRPITKRIWTENKAKFIERYLLYFVYITKHGTYIDGFAGPQEIDKPEMWAANLVLANEPRWLRHFYLYELNRKSFSKLEELKNIQPYFDKNGKKISRDINNFCGDFNILVHDLLNAKSIKPKEATFCLLDQRTFECHWSTVEALAKYDKQGENKIELFYFLPNSWQDRALSGIKNDEIVAKWWGRDDWKCVYEMKGEQRRDVFCERFKEDLGYKYVTPWPIYQKEKGRGLVMYYMIHATDHDIAPTLMERAYHNAVKPKDKDQQLKLFTMES